MEKLEYQLNTLIGPKCLNNRIKKAQEHAQPNPETLSLLLEQDIFRSKVIDEIGLGPKLVSKQQQQTDPYSNPKESEEHSLNNSQDISKYSSLSKHKLPVLRSQRTSPKRVVLRQGGNHLNKDTLMVMESDRTSAIMRAMQSHSVLSTKMSQRNSQSPTPFESLETPPQKYNILSSRRSMQTIDRVREENKDLYPYGSKQPEMSRNSSEVKLLFSEHIKNSEQSKKIKTKIANVLKDHAIEKQRAKQIIEKYSRNNSPTQVPSDRNSMRTTFNS